MRPAEVLRNLALSIERVAAQEAASGIVQGAAEGLRSELPELNTQLRHLLRDTLTVLGRMAHEAAQRETVAPEDLEHKLAAAMMSGALQALERELAESGLPLPELLERLNTLFDSLAAQALVTAEQLSRPGDRARSMTAGVVDEVADRMDAVVASVTQELHAVVPLAGEVAEHVGRGVVRGLASAVEEELRAHPGVSADGIAASVAGVAEHAAAATVRGAAGELVWQLRPIRSRVGQGTLRKATREVVGGVLDAFGERLRRPRMWVSGLLTAASLRPLRRRPA